MIGPDPNPLMAIARVLMERLQPPQPQQPNDPNLRMFGATRYTNPYIHRAIQPSDYFAMELLQRPQAIARFAEHAQHPVGSPGGRMPVDQQSEDGWAMYLGLPQTHGRFEKSPYKPTKAKDPNAVYYRDPRTFYEMATEKDGGLKYYLDEIAKGRKHFNVDGRGGNALHTVTLDRGKDEKGHYISLYDKYDLDVPVEKTGHGFGQPFEIYDRIYYDPKTFQPLDVQ